MNNQTNNVNHGVNRQLSGRDNDRLYSKTPVNNAYTAAFADVEEVMPESNVTIPSFESVLEAKDWVDNGSRT